MKISIINRQKIPIKLKDIKNLVRYVFKKEGIKKTDTEVSILLTDNKGIKKINKLYLRRPFATDVISFRMWEGLFYKIHPELLGDVVVNAELAKKRGRDFKKELALYIVHGLLHLLGYIDDTKENAKNMQCRCDMLLKGYGL